MQESLNWFSLHSKALSPFRVSEVAAPLFSEDTAPPPLHIWPELATDPRHSLKTIVLRATENPETNLEAMPKEPTRIASIQSDFRGMVSEERFIWSPELDRFAWRFNEYSRA